MRSPRLSAWLILLLALAVWGVFGYLVFGLYGARSEYVAAVAAAQEADLRGESASRLRATVQDTEVERAALESLLDVSVLRAVEILETTGRQAGATEVSIGEATTIPPAANTPAGFSEVTVVVSLQGSFTSLIRALSLYETLPVPSSIEQFEMEKQGKAWRATVRVRVFLAAAQ